MLSQLQPFAITSTECSYCWDRLFFLECNVNVNSPQCECILCKNFKWATNSAAEFCLWGAQWFLMSCNLCHHSEKTARDSIGNYVVLFKVLSGFVTCHSKGSSPTSRVAHGFCLPGCISVMLVSKLAHSAAAQSMGKAIMGSLDLPGLARPSAHHSISFPNLWGSLQIPLDLSSGRTRKHCFCWRGRQRTPCLANFWLGSLAFGSSDTFRNFVFQTEGDRSTFRSIQRPERPDCPHFSHNTLLFLL